MSAEYHSAVASVRPLSAFVPHHTQREGGARMSLGALVVLHRTAARPSASKRLMRPLMLISWPDGLKT